MKLLSVLVAVFLVKGGISNPLHMTADGISARDGHQLAAREEDHGRYYHAKPWEKHGECPAEDPALPPVEVPPPSIKTAMWIWTNEVQPPTAGGVVPVQARPFVKVLHANCSLDHVTVIMGCDNFCTLYVNGLVVGTEKNGASTNAQRYTVKFPPTHEVSIAVYAAQDPVTKLAIGLIISGVAWNSNQIKPIEIPFVTDSSWKTFAADDFDVRFIQPHFDVTDWSDALVLGAYGVSPWGSFAIPTTPTTQNGPLVAVTGLPDAPVAGPANVITLNGQ